MAKVGLIGVGNMGGGMSRNILKAGHELTVYDVRSEAMEALVQEGAGRCRITASGGCRCRYCLYHGAEC